jgi:protocatechuate 3,4-dioxygenase beta subunit
MRTRTALPIVAVVVVALVLAGYFLATGHHGPAAGVPGSGPGPVAPVGARAPDRSPEVNPETATAAPGSRAEDGGFLVQVSASGRPVSGADVRIYDRADASGTPGWRPSGAGQSGPDGTLLLAAAAGSYLVVASAPGLARGFVEAVRPAGETRTPVELKLAAAATLAGRTVERKSGEPVPFATVVATPVRRGAGLRRLELPPEERASGTSNERGEFRIAGLQPGRFEVEARAEGHAAGHRHDVSVPHGSELRIDLGAAGTVEGTVMRDGRPVPGATVTVMGAGEPAVVEAGPAGRFAADVEPGLHRAFARHGAETGSAGRVIPVAAGATVRGVEIALGPAASISGVVGTSKGPVRGAAISASLQGDAANPVRTTSQADGSYELKGLLPGLHAVSVSATGHGTAQVPAVNVRPGDRFRLDVTLVPPSVLEGTVTDTEGLPVGGALVAADGPWGRGAGSGAWGGGAGAVGGASQAAAVAARTDSSGRFRIEGVTPGQLRVSGRRDLGSPAAVKVVGVEEGETTSVDLVLSEGGVVSGAVLDAAGDPVAGAMVWTTTGNGPPRPGEARQVTSDANGAYLLALAPGSYGVHAIRPGGAFRFAGRPAALAAVQLAAGQRVEANLVLPADPPPTVSGHVLEPGAAPATGAVVWIGSPGAGLQATQSDPEGAFSLSYAAAGPVQVNARIGGRTGNATVTAPASDAVIQLQPAASLHGRLVGEPAPESFGVTTSQRTFLPGGSSAEQQFANATFDLDDVAPGQIALHVKTVDGRVGDAQVTAGAGESKAVEVLLSPACTVTGRLVDGDTGRPVTRARILVDGTASRRSGVGATGQFTRVTSEGDHQVSVAALGYSPVTVTAHARPDAPVDLGDIPMKVVASPPR